MDKLLCGDYILNESSIRFNLYIGIIFISEGFVLTYLSTFSHSTSNLVFSFTSIVIGTICVISYKFPGLISRYILIRKSLEISQYDIILKLNSRDITAWNNKGTAFAKIGLNQEAITCFDKVLEIDPEDGGAWHNKGVIFDNLRKPQEAIKFYDKALILDPKLENAKKSGKIILER